jgi:hypothetical protein
MTEDTARVLVRERETELVEWAASDLARRLKAKEKIDNPAGWLRTAIEEDWRPQRTLFAESQTQAREAANDDERRIREREAEVLSQRLAQSAQERDAIKQYIDALEDGEREALEEGFREHLASANIAPFIAKKFEGGASWYSDPIIKSESVRYLKIIYTEDKVEPTK